MSIYGENLKWVGVTVCELSVTKEDKVDSLQKELLATKKLLVDTEEEKKRLEEEISQVKEVFRRATAKTDVDIKRDAKIIGQYKEICSKLSERPEQEQSSLDFPDDNLSR
uniref:Uncharacterized protein n=1 Tax=Tetranychus urticae TaxID=32264 RepID=T1K371_TETUR